MIVFNFTGLSRVYWLPNFQGNTDRRGLWFASARWLGVEVSVYSRAMGAEVIRRFNGSVGARTRMEAAVDPARN